MTDKKELETIAELIIKSYNGSYKPHIISKEKLGNLSYRCERKDGKLSLIATDTNNSEIVITTGDNLGDFVESVFDVLSYADVKWEDVKQSSAVRYALQRAGYKEIIL